MTEFVEPSSKPDLRSYSLEELSAFMSGLGQPSFRARQLFRQVQKLAAPDFAAISDLPLALRRQLEERACLCRPRQLARHISQAGDTAKLLLELDDGQRIEMALMLYRRGQSRDRATCCVSCQSGCAMGCRFCATGLFDSFRDLTAGEMVAQVQLADGLARELGFDGVSNVVYMGMGEPLSNLANVKRSIELLNHEQGLNIGCRRITVSTCGLVPQIYQLAAWGRQIGLAISLHAAEQGLRQQLMPVAAHWPLTELLAACEHYRQVTGRRVTAEYALMENINDSPEAAQKLAALLTGRDILVNIIPANPLPERGIAAAKPEVCAAFCRTLEKAGLEVAVRESRGRDIQAACGQLRRRAD